MGKYVFLGNEIVFSDAAERFFDFQYEAWSAMEKASLDFNEWYLECKDISTVLRGYEGKALELVVKCANSPLFEQLPKLEIYDISKDTYDSICLDLSESDGAFNVIARKYNAILDEKEAEMAYRSDRKNNRGRVVGGGFGVSGAVKGMATAGAMNAVAGAGHSLVNALGNAGSAIAASSAKKELYNSQETRSTLKNGIVNDILNSFNEHMKLINERIRGYIRSAYDGDKASALFENAKKVSAKEVELLVESFKNQPWNETLLKYVFVNYKDERVNVWQISKRYHVDLSSQVEELIKNEYDKEAQETVGKAQEAKARMIAIMSEFGVEDSPTLDNMEQSWLLKLTENYESADDLTKADVVKEIQAFDAFDKNKRVVIKNKRIWELAKAYKVEFSSEEIDEILGREYDPEVHRLNQEAEKAKRRIKIIMDELGVESSATLDRLEKDCLERICEEYQNADEKTCNELLEQIKEYDALEKNKKTFLEKVQGRIEEIWAAEDGEIFDNVFLNTNIYDENSVQEAIDFIKDKGRTSNSEKYLDALKLCNTEDMKKAKAYKKGWPKVLSAIGVMFALIGVVSYVFIDLGLIISAIPMIVGVVILVITDEYKKAWKTITLNGTLVHPLLEQKNNDNQHTAQISDFKCRKCGTALKKDAVFCSECGEKQ